MVKKHSASHGGPLLLIVTTLFCLLIAEGLSRIFIPEEISSIIEFSTRVNVTHQYPSGISGRMRGSVALWHQPFETIYPMEKEPGIFRIIFIGDSMTHSYEDNADNFPALLESRLNQPGSKSSESVKVYEVFNFGVGGYDLEQIEVVFYETLKFNPDMIIYNYFKNDEGLRTVLGMRGGMFELRTYRQSVPYLLSFPGNGKLLLHSQAYRFLNLRLTVIIKKFFPHHSPPIFCVDCKRVQLALAGMLRHAKEERLPLIIMLAPDLSEMYLKGALPSENFIQEACAWGVHTWDVSRELMPSHLPEEMRISETDHHPNAAGQRAIAGALQLYLERYVLNSPFLEHLIPMEGNGVGCTMV